VVRRPAVSADGALRPILAGRPAHQFEPQCVRRVASPLVLLGRHVRHVGIPLPPPPRGDDRGLLLSGGRCSASGRVSLPEFAFRTIAGPASATAFRLRGGRFGR
jgi:hypothetical protein